MKIKHLHIFLIFSLFITSYCQILGGLTQIADPKNNKELSKVLKWSLNHLSPYTGIEKKHALHNIKEASYQMVAGYLYKSKIEVSVDKKV